jgi:glucokinase-like ROK family protein
MDMPGNEFSLPLVVGVDVGGTKIAAGVVDAQGRISGRVRQPTETSSPQATLDSIAQAVEGSIGEMGISRAQIRGVGLGIPGLVDPLRGIGINSVNLSWQNVPVKAGLEARLHLECIIENDVKAAALGEARFGAGKGLDNLVYLSIGTGIAAAIVIDHKLYRGLNGMAGEIGHAMIRRGGPLCRCGSHGCFEALASGPAIASRMVQKLESGSRSILAGKEVTAEAVYQAAAQGDELALEVARAVGEDIAFVIQFMALAYEPQVVVLGGGVANSGRAFLDPVTQALEHHAGENWVFRAVYTPDFVQLTKLGGDIGVLGAAALAAPSQ